MSIVCKKIASSDLSSPSIEIDKNNIKHMSNMLSLLMEAYPSLQDDQPVPNQLKGKWGGDSSLQVNVDGSLNLDGVFHSSVKYSLLKNNNGNQIWKLSNDNLSGTLKISSSNIVSDFNVYVKPLNGSNFGKTYNLVGISPSQPVNLTGSAQSKDVVLNWSSPLKEGSSSFVYKVYQNGSLLTTLDSSSTTYTVSNLSYETPYSFIVSAVNSYGESSSSFSITLIGPPIYDEGVIPSFFGRDGAGIVFSVKIAPSSQVSNYDIYLETQSQNFEKYRLWYVVMDGGLPKYFPYTRPSEPLDRFTKRAKIAALNSSGQVLGYSSIFTFP